MFSTTKENNIIGKNYWTNLFNNNYNQLTNSTPTLSTTTNDILNIVPKTTTKNDQQKNVYYQNFSE